MEAAVSGTRLDFLGLNDFDEAWLAGIRFGIDNVQA
jgi:hypothetical protein